MPDTTMVRGTRDTLLKNMFTKQGYKFNGWEDQYNQLYIDEQEIIAEKDLTLTAQWIPNTYTITLNNQSATNAGTASIYEKYSTGYYIDSKCTIQMSTTGNEIIVPSREGYTFGGYYTDTDGGGIQYIDASGKLTNNASTTQFSSDGTLYAKWMINPLVIYNAGTMRSGDSFSTTLDYKHPSLGSSYTNSFSTSNSKLTLSSPRNSQGMCIGITNNLGIDLSQYNRLHVSYTFTGVKSAFIFIGTDSDRQQSCGYWTSVSGLTNKRSVEFNSDSSSSDWYLDYNSSLTNGYVFLGLSAGTNGDNTKTLAFTKVWLTKE